MANAKSHASGAPSKLWTIIVREYLTRVRTRWFVIGTLVVPLLLAATFYIPMMTANRATSPIAALYNVTVIDATTTGLGERVAQLLGGGKYANQPMPEVRVVKPSELAEAESIAVRDARNERSSGYLVIDSQTVATGAAHYVGRRASSTMDLWQIQDAIREGMIGLRLEQRGWSSLAIDTLTIIAPQVRAEPLSGGGRSHVQARTIVAILLAFVMYMSIILYSQSVLSSVVEEKTSRVAEVVVSSVKPNTLLAGKVIGVSAVGLTQQIIWLVCGLAFLFGRGALSAPGAAAVAGPESVVLRTAFEALPAGTLALFVLFFLLGIAFFGSLCAAVGATVNSESDARQAAQPVIMLLVATVLFVQPVAADPQGTLARVLSLLPLSSPIIMPFRMAATDVPAWELMASIILLAASCWGVIRLSAKIYRVGLLMYGKRPSLSELRTWLKEP